MTDPRYSIIPAAAVLDQGIERGDLRVLCFLGTHTDKLGWCFLSQVTIAAELGCSRSTVQRSLARLNAAGYVQTRVSDPNSSRPHACHAYRVIMDRDDPSIGPSESEIEDQKNDAGCPPVGTPPEKVPAQDGHGGAQPYVGTERPSKKEGGGSGSARARDASVYSPDAYRLSGDLARVCGHDVSFLPPRWARDGVRVAQAFLDAGYGRDLMLQEAKLIISHKRDGAPETPSYFDKPFARAYAMSLQPHQVATISVKPNSPQAGGSIDDNRANAATDWKSSRDNWRRAAAQFSAAVDGVGRSPSGGEEGG